MNEYEIRKLKQAQMLIYEARRVVQENFGDAPWKESHVEVPRLAEELIERIDGLLKDDMGAGK